MGITLRSLSHHLAICATPEVKLGWMWMDQAPIHKDRHGLNVLVLPWPLEISPSDFRPANPVCGTLGNLDDSYGFFEYEAAHGKRESFVRRVSDLIRRAEERVGPVDMVVFPELSLTEDDVEALCVEFSKFFPPPMLVCGVCMPVKEPAGACKNTAFTVVPVIRKSLPGKKPEVRFHPLTQDKHHRWLLSGNQVRQYGLGGVLDPTRNWWEHSVVPQREVQFISLQPWLTFCTLVCEDLARPDPIANIVRAVGPNLVIALLMDGPQLSSRWPARYGTVLADDPGSSVLTVSPLGMVQLSRRDDEPPSRTIALWKDALSGSPREISLPAGHEGVILCLARSMRKEYTADGRHDNGMTAYITLAGTHPISLDKAGAP